MRITKKTQRQIDELERMLGLNPVSRALIERIAAEAAHDAGNQTAAVCRAIAADMLAEQRTRFYESLRRSWPS